MTTLYIDRRNLHVLVQGDALVFYENEQRINTIPLKILQRVCIHGNLTLSSRVLGKLGEEGIGVMILSGRQQRPTLLMPNWKLDGKRRQMQYAHSRNPTTCQQIAQRLVQEKITGQIQLLQSYLSQHSSLKNPISTLQHIHQQIPMSFNLPTLRGLEGAAAAQYFQAWQIWLPENLRFNGRNRRPPRDPINSLLSLGYTLLHFEMVKYIQMVGLDPFIGFYHSAEHGRESLACDLLEPLRPQYDAWLLAQFAQQQFTPQDFGTTTNGCTLHKEARLRFYSAYEQWAKTHRSDIYARVGQLLRALNPQDIDFQETSLMVIAQPETPESV